MASPVNAQTSSPAPLVSKIALLIVREDLQNSVKDEPVCSLVNCIINRVWDDLKYSSQNFGLEHIMLNIENDLVKSQRDGERLPVICSPAERETLLINNVNMLFRNLARWFGTERISDKFIPVDLASYARLQQALENDALQTIWNDKLSQILQYNGPRLTTPDAIKVWLNDPDNSARLTGIQTLDLTNLKLRAIPHEIAKFSQLQKLNLNDNQISSIPDSLSALASLIWLCLDNNRISSIPDSLSALTLLQELDLRGNQIDTVPDALSKLASLEYLDLNDNQISSIPDSFGQLTQLRELDLAHNQISSIPVSLGNLTKLQRLCLNNNQIDTVPDALSKLASLKHLDLNDNQISSIPVFLVKLTQLKRLCLDNNQISSIPNSFGKLLSLQVFSMANNPISISDSLANSLY
jgi:Leucine-rich repeat (LRR) protein